MNVLLWVLQVLLGLWSLIGGSYELSHYEMLKATWAAGLPPFFWMAYGVLQIFFAFGLFWRKTAVVGAIGTALLSLLGCAFFAQYAGFPGMLWGVIPAVLLAFVAYGRSSKKPSSGRKKKR